MAATAGTSTTPAPARGPHSKRWCFTVNNPGEWRPLFMPETMDYLCWELEHEADTSTGIAAGTPHIQGYVRFKTDKRLGPAKELICNAAHMEPARGNEAQNRTYCGKEGHIVEQGVFDGEIGARRGQGRRTDLSTALDKLKAGTPKMQVFMEHPELLVKYPAGMEKAAEALAGLPPPERPIHNTMLFGQTGTGKSHRVHHAFPDAYVATVGVGTFDRYAGETTVILDEFEPSLVPIQELLQWLDKWRCQVKCRYSNKWARWTHMIIISNIEPRLWYPLEHPPQREALRRRLDWPMGQVFEVKDREQEINLNWFEGLDPPVPPPTPASAGHPLSSTSTTIISGAPPALPPLSLPTPDPLSRDGPAAQILAAPNAPGSSNALPAPQPTPYSAMRSSATMSSSTQPRPHLRPVHPSPSTSPSSEPPLQRMRSSAPPVTSGAAVNQSADMDEEDVLGFNPHDPLVID